MGLAATFLATIAFAAAQAEGNDASAGVPIPGCGVCATYSLLRCLGRPASLAEVHAAFRADRSQFDSHAISIEQIRNVLAQKGVSTDALRFSPSAAGELRTPCVLYFRPGRWPRGGSDSVGHFVTLVKFLEDRAVVLDWSGVTVEPAVHLPITLIVQHWDGEAIVVHHAKLANPTLAGIVLTSCGLAAAFLFLWRRAGIGARRATLYAFLCMGALGCGESFPETPAEKPEPTLIFTEPVARLGILSPTSLTSHEFEFRVWDDGPVTIRGIDTSCGCTVPDSVLLDRELSAGSLHRLKITVRADGEASTSTKTLRIRTEPESTAPLVLAVSYERRDPPQISVRELIAETAPDRHATSRLTITYRHKEHQPSVLIDRSRSHTGDFEFVDVQTTSKTVLLNAAMKDTIIVDTTVIELRARQLHPYGDDRNQMVFQFDDGTSQTLPTLIRVPHPVKLAVDNLFAGVVSPGQSIAKRTRITYPEELGLPVFAFDGDALAGASLEDDELVVTVRAPNSAGRFSARVLISFPATELPPKTLTIVGIAKGSGDK